MLYFIQHPLDLRLAWLAIKTKYNKKTAVKVIMYSPIAFWKMKSSKLNISQVQQSMMGDVSFKGHQSEIWRYWLIYIIFH